MKKPKEKICVVCGKNFETAHDRQNRCSECILKEKKEELKPKLCKWCKKKLIPVQKYKRVRYQHFCNMACSTYFYSMQRFIIRRYGNTPLEKELLSFLEKNGSLILSAFKPQKEGSEIEM